MSANEIDLDDFGSYIGMITEIMYHQIAFNSRKELEDFLEGDINWEYTIVEDSEIKSLSLRNRSGTFRKDF